MARSSSVGVAVACRCPGEAYAACGVPSGVAVVACERPRTAAVAVCFVPSPAQIYQLRGFILEALQLADTPGGRGGKAFRSLHTGGKARSSAAESGKTLRSELINKCADML